MAKLTKYTLAYRLTENESLLINSITSAMDIVDNETRKKIDEMLTGQRSITIESDENLYKQLRERGYLYESEEEELEKIEKLKKIHHQMNQRRANTSFTICPSMGCNLRCTYCFESNSQHNDFATLTDDQLDGLFSHIYSVAIRYKDLYEKTPDENKASIKSMQPRINLFGGEPLLKTHYHIVERILDFAQKTDIPVHIITNGTTIDYYSDLLKQYRSIINIQITVDGDKEIHDKRRIRADGKGTFDEICKSIDKVLELGIRINLRINVDKDNMSHLHKLKEVFETKKWSENELFFPYVSPVQDFCGCSDNTLKEHELFDFLIKNNYYGSETSFIKGIVAPVIGFLTVFFNPEVKFKPWKMDFCEATSGRDFCFSPDGKISTCLTYVGKGSHTIGTFDKEGIKIDEDAYNLWMGRSIFRIPKCSKCKYALLCGGGCPVSALEQNKDIDCVICSDIEKTMEVYIDYMKEKLLNQV